MPITVGEINQMISRLPEDQKDLVSDGYHSFKEIYNHRHALFISLSNHITWIDKTNYRFDLDSSLKPVKFRAWKSKMHEDGSMYDGWFIAGIGDQPGETLTYHLPIDQWDKMKCPEVGHAPKWDGHTSDNVLQLIGKLYEDLHKM